VGAVPAGREPLLGDSLGTGDEIVFVASSGLHANGASLARAVADELPEGYATPLPSGRRYGEALLDPSVIYAPLVRVLMDGAVPVHYISHITGHGLLKLMRPRRELGYEIERLPPVPEVLALIVSRSGMDAHEAYSTLNMGVGLAVYTAHGTGAEVVAAAAGVGLQAHVAGRVTGGPRRVELRELGVELRGAELDLGPRA
jgi:phosphoribosylformylglycinamidine cyclo-ligase